MMQYDAFICHAHEDKDEVARPLAIALQENGFRVWYDELELKVGDSLSESIDRGLAKSQFGIVILSPNFFIKNWPARELRGLVTQEISGRSTILPIWHNISYADVLNYSPPLADVVAVSTENGLKNVFQEITSTMLGRSFLSERLHKYKKPLGLSISKSDDSLAPFLLNLVYLTGEMVGLIGDFAAILADKIGWNPDRVEHIRIAANLRNIGMISIPQSIIRKPGPLTEDEFSLFKKHTVVGEGILKNDIRKDTFDPSIEMASIIASSHHEGWDGLGYPKGLSGLEIPEESRIVTVVDVFSALTQPRSYRSAYTLERSLELMTIQSGKLFDPNIFEIFKNNFSHFKAVREALDNYSKAVYQD